jgi:alginate O-acetyltransferase complex protein AlgI
MLFGSPVFLFAFLPLVLALSLALPRRLRNGMLLLASLVFYAWGEPRFVLVMVASLAGNYVFGRLVDRAARAGRSARPALALAVAFNLGLLAWFKYAGFLWQLAGAAVPLPELEPIPLPIGISFFTFQALSYVIDVHRRDAPVQRNPLDFALYVAMFPQLIAGPIVRYRDVAVQLVQRTVDRAGFAEGVRRFVFGLGKKLLVADVVGLAADQVFALGPGELTTASAWLGIVCYTLQIYFDFSAYSDMAIGLGQMLGFRFLENFAHPYVSTSVTEFWRRWHISLSSWFRDYLYIPLGGNRGGRLRTYRNLLVVFFLCGLWHGASWTFVAWGLFHGAFLVLERAGLGAGLLRLPRPARHAYALLVVMAGWVLFRAESFEHAARFLGTLAGGGVAASAPGAAGAALFATPQVLLAAAAGAVGSLPLWPAVGRLRRSWIAAGRGGLDRALGAGRTLAFLAVLAASLVQLAGGTYSPFIYFRF